MTLRSDAEILADLRRKPPQIEALARAIMSTIRVLTGGRAQTTVTIEPTGNDPVVLPKNTYLAVIEEKSTNEQWLFKTLEEYSIVPGGTAVTLWSHLGGTWNNLPAGTRLRFAPLVEGLPSIITLTADATDATDEVLKEVAYFEDLRPNRIAQDIFDAGISRFPAALLAWMSAEPTDGVSTGTDRGDSRAGKGRLIYRQVYVLYIIVSRDEADRVRSREGIDLMEQCAALFTDRQANDDDEVLSIRGSVEIIGMTRVAQNESRYVYSVRLRMSSGLQRIWTRSFEPYTASKITAQRGPSDNPLAVEKPTARMLGVDVPEEFLGTYSASTPGYQVDLVVAFAKIGEPCAVTNYPTLGAGGYLVLESVEETDEGMVLNCREKLLFDPSSSSIDGGTVRISRVFNGTAVEYSWEKDGATPSTGALTRFGGTTRDDLPAHFQRIWRGSVRGRDFVCGLAPSNDGQICGIFAYPGVAGSGVLNTLAVAGRHDVSCAEGFSYNPSSMAAGTLRFRFVNQQLIATWDGSGSGRLNRFELQT